MTNLDALITSMPKAELHLHIEGTLEPSMLLALAARHEVELPYADLADVERAYDFADLQSFLDLYYLGAGVLRDADDFHALMKAYLDGARAQNIVHAELMFDPQTHTERGIGFEVFMTGFLRAIDEARAAGGPSVKLLMCFLRHLDEDSALATLEAAEPWRAHIEAVGLDSGEQGNPPEKFARVFAAAAERGYRRIAHAGEEGPPAYITGALDVLGVERIDHGVRCLEDDALVERLAREQVPLTVCPQSNVRLRVVERMADHPILEMRRRGLNVSVNSDDPAYFGGDLTFNFREMARTLPLDAEVLLDLAAGGFRGSFLDEATKGHWQAELDALRP
ncbi:MAG TPA: adenosine deaminase [Pseudomonadales bacterium]|nr:adenosine deaminase [Pseudomonadales bacterium]